MERGLGEPRIDLIFQTRENLAQTTTSGDAALALVIRILDHHRAADGLEGAIDQLNDLTQADSLRGFLKLIAAAHSAFAAEESPILEHQEDLLEKLERNVFTTGDVLNRERGRIGGASHGQQGTHGVFSFARQLHSRWGRGAFLSRQPSKMALAKLFFDNSLHFWPNSNCPYEMDSTPYFPLRSFILQHEALHGGQCERNVL